MCVCGFQDRLSSWPGGQHVLWCVILWSHKSSTLSPFFLPLSPALSLSFLSLPYSFSLPLFSNLIAAALWPHCGSLFDKKNPLSLAITNPIPSLPFHSLLTPNTLLCGPSLPHSLTHFHIHVFIRCPLIGLNHTTVLCVFQLHIAAMYIPERNLDSGVGVGVGVGVGCTNKLLGMTVCWVLKESRLVCRGTVAMVARCFGTVLRYSWNALIAFNFIIVGAPTARRGRGQWSSIERCLALSREWLPSSPRAMEENGETIHSLPKLNSTESAILMHYRSIKLILLIQQLCWQPVIAVQGVMYI